MSHNHRKVRQCYHQIRTYCMIADSIISLPSVSPGQSLRVTRLDYEAYTPLALKTLAAIIQRARSTPTSSWPPARLQPQRASGSHDADISGPTASSSSPSIEADENSSSAATPSTSATTPSSSPPPPDSIVRIVLLHRLGPVPTGESSILVAVSSPHRRRAFEVAEWLLEETKRIVPIWKREVRADEGGKEIVEDEEEKQAGGKPVVGEKGTRGWVGLDLTKPTNEATTTT